MSLNVLSNVLKELFRFGVADVHLDGMHDDLLGSEMERHLMSVDSRKTSGLSKCHWYDEWCLSGGDGSNDISFA